MPATATLHLNCWVVGNGATQVFAVEISKTASIGALKKAIKEKKKITLQHVEADSLALWKVSIPVDHSFPDKVELKDEEVLLPVKRLSSLFRNQPYDQNLHIVVRFPRVDSGVLELFCHIRDDNASHIFPVKIASTESVGSLKEAIKDEKKVTLQHVDADTLALWKVSIPLDGSFEENVKKVELKDEETLPPARRLSHIFSHPPREEYLHIIVQSPFITTVLGKRFYSVGDIDLARQSKLAKTAPSQTGRSTDYKSLQGDLKQRILDDRPEPDPVPPMSLLYEGFGHFMDIFSRRDVYSRKLETAVDSFAEAMTQFYSDELRRRSAGLDALNNIFSLNLLKELMAARIGTTRTDGHYNGPHAAASCIVKFKNEPVDIASIPVVELASYAAHSHAEVMGRPEGRALFEGWRVPCLGLTVVGPYITFYAMIFLGQWRVVSLTPTLSCIASACEGEDRKALYAAFSGALDLLVRIDRDAARFKNIPLKLEHGEHKLPYVSRLNRYDNPNESVKFRISGLHPDTQDYRHLYIAETESETSDRAGKTIIVKFARRYSIELHAFCAGRTHAPKILGFERLPGGWFAIAMDYITPTVHPFQSPNLAIHCKKWTDELETLMKLFHQDGFVHGDLREPNLLCDEDQVMLIDFDWGGKVGEAYYPSAKLCSELTDGRDDTSSKITKADDIRVLRSTLKKMKEKVGLV